MKIYLYTYLDGNFTVKPIEVKETAKLYRMPYGNSYTQIKKEDIGVVTGGYYYGSISTYLVERDDKKARDLFFEYFNTRISELGEEKENIDKRISELAETGDKILKIGIKEKEEDSE